MNPKLIACRSMIEEMRSYLPEDLETTVFDIGLHTRPQVLHDALQHAIGEADGKFDPLLLGYGLCGQAVIGLQAKKSRMVILKRHDCIGVFLGSEQARRHELDSQPGTLYLTHGYIEGYRREGRGPFGESQHMQERYGAKWAAVLVQRMMARYKRVVYLRNMRLQDLEGDRNYARHLATEFNLSYSEAEADPSLLRELITSEWERDFVVVQPGREIRLEDFM